MTVRPLGTGPLVLASAMAVSGVVHLVHPSTFDAVVPRGMPGSARGWVLASGAAELACAAAMLWPPTRAAGGLASAALMAAVFPGNVQMARDARRPRTRAITLLRLPLQIPLVLWGLRAARSTGR
ncbi:MauE/DoxX family redox-associated membrane protein [Rathayibacter sp. VKM Ac-2759]|uniref:DoxX family protein n=1 Tax=Rathayibacter sp. VKM Ac-2759 TaxID=2609252 RepID=UPI001ABE4B14|nr:MauE/DoxX family redox-associated membrane protein [Rathayibacter sp. VKM Ac-2759]